MSAVQHLKKLISSFYKDHPEKPTATFLLIYFAPPMARPTVKPTGTATTKRKQGWPANSASKRAKNWTYTGSRNNQPLIRWWLDSFSFFAKFPIFSNLIYKSIRFPPQSYPIKLRDFLLLAVYQTIFLIIWFFLLSSDWVRRFFHWQISFNLFLSFPTGLRGFLHQTIYCFSSPFSY